MPESMIPFFLQKLAEENEALHKEVAEVREELRKLEEPEYIRLALQQNCHTLLEDAKATFEGAKEDFEVAKRGFEDAKESFESAKSLLDDAKELYPYLKEDENE